MNLDSIMDTYTKAHLVELLTSNERKASELNRLTKKELAELFVSLKSETIKEAQKAPKIPKSELY